MKKTFFGVYWPLVMAVILSPAFVSCGSDDEEDENVSVSTYSLTFSESGGEQYVSVSSNTTWMVSSTESWCTVTPTNGKGNGTIGISVSANESSEERSCYLQVIAGSASTSIKVSQSAPSVSVTPTDINLAAEENSSSSFTINTTASWTASCPASWLTLGSTSGNGSTTVSFRATANESSDVRSTVINVQIGSLSRQINVTQDPLYINAYANVDESSIIALTTSAAFRMTYSGDVSSFYLRWMDKSTSASLSDEEVISWLSANYSRTSVSEWFGEYDECVAWPTDVLSANTNYVLFTVAYNAQGKRGPVQRYEFTTPRSVTNRPRVTYGSVYYDSYYWHFSTTIGAYAKRYYMLTVDDAEAYKCIYNYTDAVVAYFIQDYINSGELTPIVNSSSWTRARTSGARYFYSAAWAQGDDGNMSGVLDSTNGYISSSSLESAPMNDNKPKFSVISMKELKELASHMKISTK